MELRDAEAFSFDCYGTLVDWEAGLTAVLRPWARRSGLGLDDDDLLAAYGRHEEAAERSRPTDLYPAIVGRSFRAMGKELGAEVSDADAEALARSVPDWPAFPDSHDALVALGWRAKLVILSNVDRRSFAGSAERLGVEFTSVLTAQDVGSYKPSPRNFAALIDEARRLGVRDGRLVHVAQSLFHDHVPAQAAGLPTVWIDRRQGRAGWGATPAPSAPVRPDWRFGSMAAFAEAVTG
jgi:2-haloalkanoic acid dehalogenase type II